MRPKARAYTHQGHGPRADQTGRIHISDFRFPRTNSLAISSRSIHLGHKRGIASSLGAWGHWSATMDEIAILTERLVATPATDLESLAGKFTAILWPIEINQSLLDSGDLRHLRRFRRDLSALAGGKS